MDDLSLPRIHFKGENLEENNLYEDLKLLEKYKEEENYKEFIEIGSKVMTDHPYLTDLLLQMSIESGQYEKAIEFGERFFIRDAKNIINLSNLIESFNGLEKKSRAKNILKACLKVKPNDETLLKLKEELMG